MAYTQTFGAIPSKVDIRDYIASVSEPIELPDEFELEMCEVKNQGSVGSCVAYSISSVVEYFNKLQEKKYVKMSTGFIYGNRIDSGYTGTGMYVSEALKNTVKYGDVPNTQFSYNIEVPDAIEKFMEVNFELAPEAIPNRFSSYFRLDSIEAIKVNLIQNGPVVFAMPWYSDIYVSKDGIMIHNTTDTRVSGNHCMVIYGWNEQGWKIQNSWGTGWGVKGRAILPYNIGITEAYGITDEISETLTIERMKDLERSNKDYQNRINELHLTLTSLQEACNVKEKQIQESQALLEKIQQSMAESDTLIEHLERDKLALTEYIKDLQESYNTFKEMYDENVKELDEYAKTIEDQKKTIEVLEKDLMEIEKPYKYWWPFLVKAINWIINLFKKKN